MTRARATGARTVLQGLGRRLGRGLAFGLAGAEVLYLIVANSLLLTPLPERWANRDPDGGEGRRVRVTWQGAWTVVPPWVHASSVVVQGRGRSRPWSVTLSSVNARFGLLPLRDRRLVLGGRVGDVEARIGAEGAERPRWPRRPRSSAERWELVLDDVVARGSHRLVLEDQDLVAQVDGRLQARMDQRIGEWAELPVVRVHGAGFVRRNGASILEPLTIDGSGRFARFDPGARGAVGTLEAFDGTIELSGTVRESGALGARLPDGVSFARGGTVRATLDLERGRLGPRTVVDLSGTQVEAGLLGFVAKGVARAQYGVRREGDVTVGSWDVELEKVALRRDPASPPDAIGSLRVESTEREPFLFRRPEGMTTVFDLHDASIPDLGVLADLIPPRAGIVFEEGRGRFRSRFTVSPAWTVSGTMEAEISDLVATVLGYEVRGALDVRFALDHGDPQARSFDLADAELRFREGRLRELSLAGDPEVTAAAASPWWMVGTVPAGKVRFGSPLSLSASTTLRLSDLRPVVAFLTHKSRIPGGLAFASKIRDIAAVAQVDLDGGGLRITDATLTSDRLDVRGSLRIADGGVRGRALMEHGRLAVGVAVSGDERDWKLRGARAWFASSGRLPGDR